MTLANLAAVGRTAQGAAAMPLALRGPAQRTTQLIECAPCPTIPVGVLTHLADALSVPDAGFSITVEDCADVRAGYAVSIFPQWEWRIAGPVAPEDIARYVATLGSELVRPELVFGGWRNPENGAAYLDVSIVVPDHRQALALARANTQAAIWDFAAGASIAIEPVRHGSGS